MAETTMEELNIEEFEKKEEIVFFKEEILLSSTLEAIGNNGYVVFHHGSGVICICHDKLIINVICLNSFFSLMMI